MEDGEKRTIRWYEIVYVVVLLALLIMSVFYMNPHKVAVIDVDRIFKTVGMTERIEADRQKLEAFNRGQSLVKAYNTRMSTLKTNLEAAKTQAEKDKIQSQMKSSGELMQQSLAPIQTALQSHEAGVVTTFRRRLQPYVTKVAKKRRVDVVIYAGPSLLYIKSTVDITDDVIKACKEFFAKDMPLVDPAVSAAQAPAPAKKK